MKLDAKNNKSIRDFENWVKGELYGPRKEAERDNQMQCLTCGMMDIDPLSHTHTKETQPMSDTLLEPEDQTATDYCPECKGRPHAPWCSEFEPPETEANQLLPDGISSVSAGNEHQPAAQGGGDEWRVEEQFPRIVVVDSSDNAIAFACGNDTHERFARANRITNEHNEYQSLVAERERLLAALRQAHDAALVFVDSRHPETAQQGLLDIAGDIEKVLSANEQRSTSE